MISFCFERGRFPNLSDVIKLEFVVQGILEDNNFVARFFHDSYDQGTILG